MSRALTDSGWSLQMTMQLKVDGNQTAPRTAVAGYSKDVALQLEKVVSLEEHECAAFIKQQETVLHSLLVPTPDSNRRLDPCRQPWDEHWQMCLGSR
ncbi:hypothetical protein WJX74_010790 [Apatococcus lobatus]|uniref:Uncharacterized protein n=1 Tax=Apatococcus lobatus TaxID=904363 RepID=A0AAW1R0I1_9CHLO